MKVLRIKMNDMEHEANQMTVRVHLRDHVNIDEPLLVLTTAVIIVTLERFFPSERAVWGNVVDKSRSWLFEFIHRYRPKIQDRDIMNWAEEFVQRHVKLLE